MLAARPMFRITEVTNAQDYQAALKIQAAVFVTEQRIPRDATLDELNARSIHVLAFADQEPVATARMTIEEDGHIATIARVAVLASCRNFGLGRKMVEKLEMLGRKADVRTTILRPHFYLETFYNELGYERIDGGDHIVAEHRLITMQKEWPAP